MVSAAEANVYGDSRIIEKRITERAKQWFCEIGIIYSLPFS